MKEIEIGLKPTKYQKKQSHYDSYFFGSSKTQNSFTVSFHNGTAVRHGHNIRDPKIVENEKHIDPEGHYEIWEDIPISKAYSDLFGKAVQEYNSKQKRTDRKIKSYLDTIRKDKFKNDCYEFIYQIGNFENHLDDVQSKKILKKYLEEFKTRNPQLKVIGAYYHADEKTPHVHVDYIPFADGFKKGLSVQNSLSRALKKQGFENKTVEVKEIDDDGHVKIKKKLITAEMQWQESERLALQKLCEKNNIKIIQPERKPEEYEDSKILKKARDKIREDVISFTKYQDNILNIAKQKISTQEQEILERENELSKREKQFNNEVIYNNFSQHLAEIFGQNFEQFSQVETSIRENKTDKISSFESLKKNCINLFEKIGYAIKKQKTELHDYKDTPIDSVINNLENAKALGYKTYGEFLKSNDNAVTSTKSRSKRG